MAKPLSSTIILSNEIKEEEKEIAKLFCELISFVFIKELYQDQIQQKRSEGAESNKNK